MELGSDGERVNQEWITLNAIRGMIKIATKGDMSKGTYDNSLDFGAELYPELLGPENSLLRRVRESDTAREYRQRAELRSISSEIFVDPVKLLEDDISEFSTLINLAKLDKKDQKQTDQLKKRLGLLEKAKEELSPIAHSENKIIFRDAYNVDRKLPEFANGFGKKDYQLPDGNFLRLRVLHPDRPEHITGADIIYERHDKVSDRVSVVVVQYKIWEKKTLYIADERLNKQIVKMKEFTCGQGLCKEVAGDKLYRFPHCSAFLRPTDKLQTADQKFISTGEHLPICRIEECKSTGVGGGEKLEYEKIKATSISSELFEELFNRGKIGSRSLTHDELKKLYEDSSVIDSSETVIIYAQEF
jgi:hypothetical protein